MSEFKKTIVFVAVGVVGVAVLTVFGFASRSWEAAKGPQGGDLLFPDFEPLDVTSLEIVKYDESTSTPRAFKVAQVHGRWSIPSHYDYPAEAQDQLAEAASSMMGLKVVRVVSDTPSDHVLYGVLDPGAKDLAAAAVGVGTRVVMKDPKDKTLLAIVIGKEVPGEAKAKAKIHYVRCVGRDPTYEVAVNTDKLSTKFEDWIEKNLLKLSTWDISQVQIRDYSVDEVNQALIQRGDILLDYKDTGDPKWKMAEDKVFEKGKWVPVTMADDEELNTSKLDDMKSALGDLKIIDVRRKPAGLSADLKAQEDFIKNSEAVVSLGQKGFYVARLGSQIELFSNQGDIRCLTKDGARYILRFGDFAEDTGDASAKKEEGKEGQEDKKDTKEEKSGGLNRYIFVTTEFEPDVIPKPELQPLPEEKPASAEGKPAEEKKPDASADEKKDDPKEEKKDEIKDEKKEEKKDERTAEQKEKDLKEKRERIEKENKRKQDEYNEKIKKGKEKVQELNGRFAEWYYIISDETYRKIHLGRNDIVKKKEKKEEKDKKDEKDEKKTGGDEAEHKHGDAADHRDGDKPAESSKPLDEFDRLKQEGPGGEK